MAKPSSRFLKGKKIKNPGATVIKRFTKAIQKLESEEGSIGGEFKIFGASDFSALKTVANKFPQQCNKAHELTLQALALDLEIALTEAMNSKVWDWDYGDGDIVQTGALRDSLRVEATTESLIVNYSAASSGDGTDYAAIVYYGGYINPYGNPLIEVYMPPRPWIKEVLVTGGRVPKFPLTQKYLYYFEKYILQEIPNLFK